LVKYQDYTEIRGQQNIKKETNTVQELIKDDEDKRLIINLLHVFT